jgi:hypothetical protein
MTHGAVLDLPHPPADHPLGYLVTRRCTLDEHDGRNQRHEGERGTARISPSCRPHLFDRLETARAAYHGTAKMMRDIPLPTRAVICSPSHDERRAGHQRLYRHHPEREARVVDEQSPPDHGLPLESERSRAPDHAEENRAVARVRVVFRRPARLQHSFGAARPRSTAAG